MSVLFTLLFVPSFSYYAFMKRKASKDWGLVIDKKYQPKVSIIIATYNEVSVIEKRLENIQELDYPTDKLQVVIVDSASTDGTTDACRQFLEKNNLFFPKAILLSEAERMGKSHALNTALEYTDGEIIATSDADSFWEPDALSKATPYFADAKVGAVTGREELINLKKTVHTQSEGIYRQYYYTLRLGESKADSTFIFQGELSLYRKSVLKRFEDRPGYSDDIGTVVNIISSGYRCIFLPEAVFHDTAAFSLRGRLVLKSRRAEHLISGIMRSSRLKLQKKLPLSSAIVFFNFYLHIISPLIFLLTIFVTIINIQSIFYLAFLLIPLLAFTKSRVFFFSYLTSNIALVAGLIRHFVGKKKTTWSKVEEMRDHPGEKSFATKKV